MDKYGIFELLDALSAIAFDGKDEAEEQPAEPPQTPPHGDDPVYRPPVYNGEEPSAPPQPQNTGAYAINEFYRKHDERSKR